LGMFGECLDRVVESPERKKQRRDAVEKKISVITSNVRKEVSESRKKKNTEEKEKKKIN